MLRILIIIALISAVISFISTAIPDSFTGGINSAIIYFLSAIWNLNGLFDVSVFFDCVAIMANFTAGLALFFGFHYILTLAN